MCARIFDPLQMIKQQHLKRKKKKASNVVTIIGYGSFCKKLWMKTNTHSGAEKQSDESGKILLTRYRALIEWIRPKFLYP